MHEPASIVTEHVLSGRKMSTDVSFGQDTWSRRMHLWKPGQAKNLWEKVEPDLRAEQIGSVQWTTATIQSYVRMNIGLLTRLTDWWKKRRRSLGDVPGHGQVALTTAPKKNSFMAWTADRAGSIDEVVHKDARRYAKIEFLGKSAAMVQGMHPVLLDLAAPPRDPLRSDPFKDKLPELRELLAMQDAKIVSEHLPEHWDRFMLCFQHFHGTKESLLELGDNFFTSSAFIEHQLRTHGAAERAANKFGLPNTKVFVETFPNRLTSPEDVYAQWAIEEFEYSEENVRGGVGIPFLQERLMQAFEEDVVTNLPPIDAGRRLVGKLIKADLMGNIFGDGRVDAAQGEERYDSEIAYVIPNATLSRQIHQHVGPGDLGILIYGAAHFESEGPYARRPRSGFLDEYLRNIPRLGYFVVDAGYNSIKSKVNAYRERMARGMMF